MNVRFDNSKSWKAADGRVLDIAEMETSHIMNTLRMFMLKPHTVMSMIVRDIDQYDEQQQISNEPWTPHSDEYFMSAKQMSMHSVTSMHPADLTRYAVDSPLGRAMIEELKNRGVNTDNLFLVWAEEVKANEQ